MSRQKAIAWRIKSASIETCVKTALNTCRDVTTALPLLTVLLVIKAGFKTL